EQEDIFYYFTIGNENYPQPPMAEGVRDGILRGLYRFRKADGRKQKESARKERPRHVHLLGSGAILNEVVKAQQMLAERYDGAADVCSVTSYTELRREALDVERWNLLRPDKKPKVPYVTHCFADESGVFVAAVDFLRALP